MSFAKPLTRLSAIIRAPVMTHADHSTESDWFYPYDGPIEPPPPPTRHPFAAAEISQPKPIPAKQSRSTVSKFESRERAGDDARSRSRSRSRDTKRKSQRSYQALDTGGGVGAYPAPEKDKDREQSVYSDHTFGAHSSHTTGHVRGRSSLGLSGLDPKFTFPWPDDSITVSSGGKHSDPPAVMFANHPFRMHTGSPPPRSHTASLSTSTTPWVRTITASPAPPDPAPMRKRTLTYQPGLVTMFGSNAETRVGYRTSGAFVDLDEREREKIRPTLLPPSLSLVGKGSNDDPEAVDEHGQRTHYDLRSHPYALNAPPVRETRFGSVSTTTTTTTGGTGKPPVPPRPAGLKLKSSLKASASTPELRIRIPSTIPASGHSAGRTPDELGLGQAGLGARPIPRSAPGPGSASAAAGPTSTFEARTICDALIFARPRFRVNAHEITPPESPKPDEEKRASVAVGESGFKGLACFPRKVSRDSTKDKAKERPHPPLKEFKSLEDVLRDGEKLDREREEWNALGQGSLLNSRARSLSRSHTKSGGARVGIGRPRRDTHSVNEEGQKSGWGTLKLKRSVEMLAATAFSQGHGHAPSVSASSSRRGHGTLRSVSATSHVRGASTSVKSTAHSRAESWGQRVACGSRSGSSLGGETTGTGTHMGQSSEGLLPGGPKRTAVEDYPVVDIRPVPVGNTNRARAPPPPPGSGFNIAGPSRAHASPSKSQRQSPGPSHALLYSMQSPSPSGSAIGLALSSPNGTTASLILPHPFAQRAGAYPADPGPLVTGPETIATRHRHPPRSSGSTEHARLDEPSHIIRTVPPIPSLSRSNTPSASKSAPPSDHPFVARQTIVGAPSGDVQRMFENAMLRSAEGEFDEPPRPSDFEVNPRRGSGDSGIGSSVNDYTGSIVRAAGLAAAVRGSAFGPPTGLDEMLAGQGQGQSQAPPEPQPSTSPKAASPQESAQSPQSPMDSLSPSSGSRRAVLTRTSSGMIDPALAGAASRSHESSSSSFSSPRPLGASIDDIESLRDIFYRPSPVPRVASHQDSPPTEHILSEEDEDVLSSDEEDDGGERTERQPVSGGGAHEDWTFGRRPFELQRESHLIWERRREGNDNTPLMINIAPGTPSPTLLSSAPASAPMYQDVPESVHDSDSQSERSVMTTSSQRATNENVTFGVVPSTQVDTLSVNVASRRQSTALSVIDMYDYESSSPNTPQIFQTMSPPYDRPSTFHSNTTDPYPRESYYTTSSAAGSRPGMDHLISGFPTPPAEGTSVSATVLSSYFAVDNQSRQAD